MPLKRDEFFQDSSQLLQHLHTLEGVMNQPTEIKVPLRADESISPGKFKADPLIPGGYLANELTIRAVRMDIFIAGGVDELALEQPCPGCGQTLDWQFWRLCPYCARPHT